MTKHKLMTQGNYKLIAFLTFWFSKPVGRFYALSNVFRTSKRQVLAFSVVLSDCFPGFTRTHSTLAWKLFSLAVQRSGALQSSSLEEAVMNEWMNERTNEWMNEWMLFIWFQAEHVLWKHLVLQEPHFCYCCNLFFTPITINYLKIVQKLGYL